MSGNEFEQPESYRGRLEWKLEDEKERRKREATTKSVSSYRRFTTMRRGRYSRCCKIIFVLAMSMVITQAFFYYTGGSISTFDYKRTMPMALFFDAVGHDYERTSLGMHEEGQYDTLRDDEAEYDAHNLVDELTEEDYELVERDYEYSDAINQVRDEMVNGVREEAIETANGPNQYDEEDGVLEDDDDMEEVSIAEPEELPQQDIMFIPRDSPLPPMPQGPADKLPSLPKKKKVPTATLR